MELQATRVEAHTVDVVKRLDRYEKKLGRTFFGDWNINQFPFLLLMEDGSICAYGLELNTIVVGPTSGNFKPVLDKLIALAHGGGISKIKTTTPRNPEAYKKLSGAKMISCYVEPSGYIEYTFELEV